jgi:hypothetical protein
MDAVMRSDGLNLLARSAVMCLCLSKTIRSPVTTEKGAHGCYSEQ